MSKFKVYKKSEDGIVKQELITYRVQSDGLLKIETETRELKGDDYHDSYVSNVISTKRPGWCILVKEHPLWERKNNETT